MYLFNNDVIGVPNDLHGCPSCVREELRQLRVGDKHLTISQNEENTLSFG